MSRVGRKTLERSGGRFVAWLVLMVGLAATGSLHLSIAKALRTRNRNEFDRQIDRLTATLGDSVRDQVAVLHAVAGAVSADPALDQRGFARFYAELRQGASARIPVSVGLSLFRPWAKRGELAIEAKRRGVEGFRFRPETPRSQAFAVVLTQPLLGPNQAAPGFDMHAEPIRARAIDRALAIGGPAMTSSLSLALDPIGSLPSSFLLFAPVYAHAAGGDAIGIAYCGLRARDLLAPMVREATGAEVGLRLWSGDPGSGSLIFGGPRAGGTKFRKTRTIPLPGVGQSLSVEFNAGADFGTPATVLPYVLPIGSALSLLLFSLALTLSRAQEASERRASEQTLIAEVGRLTAGAADDDAVLQGIALTTARTLHAVCRIDLIEEDGSLRHVSTRTENAAALAAHEREYPRLEHDEVLKAALASGCSQRTSGDAATEPSARRNLAELGIGPVLIVPLCVRERTIGAITLTRFQRRSPLTPDAEALAEAIAGRLALAVENARLYRAVQRENDELERRVEERTRDLEASNHELESFCYSVSHDLRTPLRSLDGFARLLQKDYGERLDEQGMDYIERILGATRRMDELITALLTLSRLTRREIVPSVVDVTAMVRDVMHELDPEDKIRLSVEGGLSLVADPRMLVIMFDNLLGNAVKFSDRIERPEITVGKTTDNAVFIRDNGAGFDMAYAAKLFQPFERLHSAREFPGHGIGLATVERIVRRHAGEVWAESRPHEGATFFLRFPGPV